MKNVQHPIWLFLNPPQGSKQKREIHKVMLPEVPMLRGLPVVRIRVNQPRVWDTRGLLVLCAHTKLGDFHDNIARYVSQACLQRLWPYIVKYYGLKKPMKAHNVATQKGGECI